jgi:hypothetical protein
VEPQRALGTAAVPRPTARTAQQGEADRSPGAGPQCLGDAVLAIVHQIVRAARVPDDPVGLDPLAEGTLAVERTA